MVDIHFAIIFLAENKIKAVDNFLILPFIAVLIWMILLVAKYNSITVILYSMSFVARRE